MNWQTVVYESIGSKLQTVGRALASRFQAYREACWLLQRFEYAGFLLEENLSLDLTSYLAPHPQPSLTLVGHERAKVVPLQLGFNPGYPESHFWLRVKEGVKEGEALHLYVMDGQEGFLPEVEDGRIAAILAEATAFHPRRVASLLKGLDLFQTQAEREISRRTEVLLVHGKELRESLEEAMGTLEGRVGELVNYLKVHTLSPAPSPLLEQVLSFSLETFLPKVGVYPYPREGWIRIGPEGVEVEVEYSEAVTGRGKRVKVGASTLWNLLDPALYGSFLEALAAFATRVGGILAEAKVLSQGLDLKEALSRVFKGLKEQEEGLLGLIQAYPFSREFLPRDPLVLEVGDPNPPWRLGIEAVAANFGGENLLAYRDPTGDWRALDGEGVEKLGDLLSLPEGEARKATQVLVEFTAILGQIRREAQRRVEAIMGEKEAQEVQDYYLATKLGQL